MCQGTSFCEEEKLKRNRNGIEGSKPTAKHNPHVYSAPLRVHGSLLCPWPSGPGEFLGDTKALEEGAECPEIFCCKNEDWDQVVWPGEGGELSVDEKTRVLS